MFHRLKLFAFILVICLIWIAVPAITQQVVPLDYPTMTALENAVIPPLDRVKLAQSLRQVGEIPPPPESVLPRQVGEQQIFNAINTSENRILQVEASLRVRGEHIYLWVENGADVSDEALQSLADAFDQRIYPAVRELWGSEPNPGIDGDPRIYALFAYNLGWNNGAYFSSDNLYPSEVVPTSNQHEMILFNLSTLGTGIIGSHAVESVTAHEFQHMIRSAIKSNEDTWLNEGFSGFTQLLLYGDSINTIMSYMAQPYSQLNTWPENSSRIPHYGAGQLFTAYFYERYGLQGLQQVSAAPGRGLAAFEAVLRQMGEPGVNEFFADWLIANAFLNPTLDDGRYGYTLLPDWMPRPAPRATALSYPFRHIGRINQYAGDYVVLTNLEGLHALEINLEAPATIELLPVNAYSGSYMWYSNRADFSETTLTQAFDLTGVSGATLQFQTWYHIENLWDYAYIMVSADDGATWDILPTPNTTSSNPHGTAYGPGYTGYSGGWFAETVSLDAYAGQTILLRFAMITDDATNQPGMVIDDVGIPEIGYFSNFEGEDGGWAAAGWVRIDNILPQQVWVQVAQTVGSDISLSRWLAIGGGRWHLPLKPGLNTATLVISPFAPDTTTPMSYILEVAPGR